MAVGTLTGVTPDGVNTVPSPTQPGIARTLVDVCKERRRKLIQYYAHTIYFLYSITLLHVTPAPPEVQTLH